MTPQEQEMIDGLVQRIRSTQVQDKDTQAEQYIQQQLAGYPDTLYVMAQTLLVQQYGLQQAQQQIDALKQQLDQAKQAQPQSGGGSFLSHLFGGQQQPQPPQQQPTQYQPVNNPGYAPGYAPAYGQPMYAQPVYAQPMGYGMGGGGGFLRGALQTAAGVAAGEFLVDELFHGFGGHEGYGGAYGGPREEVVNNYYGDGAEHEHHEASRDDGSFYNPGHDASSSDAGSSDSGSSDKHGFADTGDDSKSDDSSSQSDDSGYDASDAGYDSGSDSTSFDDSGSGFDGGGGGGDDSGSF